MSTSFTSASAIPIDATPGVNRRSAHNDDARQRGGRLSQAVRSWFGKEEEQEAPSLFQQIGLFLDSHQLEPSPAHYELAHGYLTRSDRKLIEAVDRAIARLGRLTPDAAELILGEVRTDMSAEMLAGLIDKAQSGLTHIAGLARQSGADAKAYGQALETKVADLLEGSRDETIAALVELTGSMIEKTRAAEQQLRDAGKQMNQLRGSLAEARRLAESDQLTGLANRRAFENRFRRAVMQARETGKPLALAFCDIDHFKQINDTHGHDVGDRILKFVAQRLASASGNNCFVARHGGEEFVMLFEGMTAEEAGRVVDNVRADLEERRLVAKQSGEPIGRVSFSAGVASLMEADTGRAMLRAADQALYRAKNEGRNRVEVAG
ncbi:GGDEF domain-containing protein [Sphingomonas sp. ID1715]|uniref:GGDEF domain-containing protein n=1 Tax=Sphingomonas sp. ID1715 TaxID=1656898 RepID=UPI001489AD5D|nr:GGDEF domain-containing protein [Sphingomonas sp. ID1715]NNM75757.1 GGDEF domain-containing protein [Sphingomonas sp. ID1715]